MGYTNTILFSKDQRWSSGGVVHLDEAIAVVLLRNLFAKYTEHTHYSTCTQSHTNADGRTVSIFRGVALVASAGR